MSSITYDGASCWFSNIPIPHSVMFDGECKNSRLILRVRHGQCGDQSDLIPDGLSLAFSISSSIVPCMLL